jgi:hypothetical protein
MRHLFMLSLLGLSVTLTGICAVKAVEVIPSTSAAWSMGITLVTISAVVRHLEGRDRPWTLPHGSFDKPQAPGYASAVLTAACWL